MGLMFRRKVFPLQFSIMLPRYKTKVHNTAYSLPHASRHEPIINAPHCVFFRPQRAFRPASFKHLQMPAFDLDKRKLANDKTENKL